MSERGPRRSPDERRGADSSVEERLRAVERALTGTDRDLTSLETAAQRSDRVDDVDRRLATVEEQVADLEAAVQAIRGYVGAIRAVNRDVERRAEAALAAATTDEGTGSEATTSASDEPPSAEKPSADEPVTTGPPEGIEHLRADPDGRSSPSEGDAGSPPGESNATDDAVARATDGATETDDDHRWPWEEVAQEEGDAATGGEDSTAISDDVPGVDDADPDGPVEATDRPSNVRGDESSGARDDRPFGTARDDRRSAGDDDRFEWPPGEGVDVDRAQPWTVPDVPAADAPEEDPSLLERIRESL